MPITKFRRALIGAALGVIGLWMSMQLFGIGVVTAIPRVNLAISFAATACLAFECSTRFAASKRSLTRFFASFGTLIFGLATLLVGCSILVWTPETNLGEVSVRHGRLVAHQNSVPLVAESVQVRLEIQILPGLYAFQMKALLDPAWDANVRVTSKALLVSYIDANGLQRHLEVSP
jgi:hypothetical protein